MSTIVSSNSFVLFRALFAWLFFFFIIKRETLDGEAPTEIESALSEQTKKCDFVSFKTFYQRQFFTTVKWIFKNIF